MKCSTKKNLTKFAFTLVILELCVYLSNDGCLPAIPAIGGHFNLDNNASKWIITLWFLGSSSMTLVIGTLAEKFGRTFFIKSSAIIYVIASTLCFTTDQYYIFLISRFFQGMCAPLLIVPGYSIIHEKFNDYDATRIIGKMNAIVVLAPALGPLVGSFLYIYYGWQSTFYALALLTILITLFIFMFSLKKIKKKARTSIISSFHIKIAYPFMISNAT